MNSENEVKLRKNAKILIITGTGVIIFGAWNFLKILYYCFFDTSYIESIFDDIEGGNYTNLVIVILILIMTIDTLIRLYAGKRAVYEAKGEKQGYIYIVMVLLFTISSFYSLCAYFNDISQYTNGAFDAISGVVVETTSLVISIELIISAINVKKLRKKLVNLSESNGEH